MPTADLPDKKSKNHLMNLSRQIQISGLIALFLFLGVVFLSSLFFRQIQIQNQNYEVGTIFSDRSVTQLQREVLRLRSIIANPALSDEESFKLQTALVQSRLNILEDSLGKIQPTDNILNQFDQVMYAWDDELEPVLLDWQAIRQDDALQTKILILIDGIELKTNDIVRQYEILRLERGQSLTEVGERLGILLGVVVLLFILFMVTVIYNTYRFIQVRSRAEAQLAVYAAELERSNYELEHFAYAASHDLQEPLRKIRVFGERLQKRNGGTLDNRSQDYIARMNNAAERMQSLIEGLLALSRVTTKAAPFEPTDLNQIAEEVILDLETRIEDANGRIDIETLPTIEADPMQMRQLIQNLISNGLKFQREDVSPVVKITGESFQDNGRDWIHLYVADNGIGIEEAYLERIFEVFQRLHSRAKYEGSGVGLAICRRIVDRHHGTISARSEPGEGATFIVTLPVKQNH